MDAVQSGENKRFTRMCCLDLQGSYFVAFAPDEGTTVIGTVLSSSIVNS